MRRHSRFPLFIAAFLLFVLAPNLASQRRPDASPFPEDAPLGTTRAHAYSITGEVVDAVSHARLNGVRVDLQSAAGGILATAFTSGNGNFQFNNVRSGNYELTFEEIGYQDTRETVEIEGPTMGVSIAMRKLNETGAGPGGPPTVSVRELSIPQKARDAMMKGVALFYQKSDYPGSIKQFERATQIFPSYYEAYAQMGLAYIKMNDSDRAEQSFRKSVEVSEEKYSDGLFLLAAFYTEKNRFADSEPLARKAIELDPDSWHAQSELAQALLGLKRADEAEKYAQAAVKLQPENPTLRLVLANIHIQLENDPALIEDLNAYLKLAPNGPFADQARKQRDEVQQRVQSDGPSGPATPGGSAGNDPATPGPNHN